MIDCSAQLAQARAHLATTDHRPSAVSALGAAAFAATASLLLAGVVVMGPDVQIEEPVVIVQP